MTDEQEKKPQRVRFIYQKARHHRTFHADGVWAGVTPQLEVQFAFFNDLRPMPDEVTHKLTNEGLLGEEIERQHEMQDVTREVNVTVVMNTETTKQLLTLLAAMVKQAEDAAVDLVAQHTALIKQQKDESSKVS